jgi:hypothetical protein
MRDRPLCSRSPILSGVPLDMQIITRSFGVTRVDMPQAKKSTVRSRSFRVKQIRLGGPWLPEVNRVVIRKISPAEMHTIRVPCSTMSLGNVKGIPARSSRRVTAPGFTWARWSR